MCQKIRAALLHQKDLILKVKKRETYFANVLEVLSNRSDFLNRRHPDFYGIFYQKKPI